MLLNDFKISGTGLSPDLQGNAVSASVQNMSNWNTSGDVSISYADGVNTLEYGTMSGPGSNLTLQQIKDFYASYGLTNIDTLCSALYNSSQPTGDRIYGLMRTATSGTNATIVLFAVPTRTDYTINNYDSGWDAYYLLPNSSWTAYGTIYDTIIYNYDNHTYTLDSDHCGVSSAAFVRYFHTLPEVILSNGPIPLQGNIQLNSTVEDEKVYLVKFKACSTSGFNAGSLPNTIITCGSNSVNGNISSTASNTLVDYKYIIVSDGTTLNIKFDFGQMQKASSDVVLKLSDFGVYKVSDTLDYWSDGTNDIENNDGDKFVFLG